MTETRRLIDLLTEQIEDIARRFSVNVTAELQRTTPVDTGWARANWVPSIGEPFEGNSESITPTSADVSSANSEQQSGIASLLSYRIDDGEIFVSNNVPYILSLNDGSSAQAPPMFVERAIEVQFNELLLDLDSQFAGL
jgi:hypothetical protein